jgi:hypothetical protein
MGVLKKDKLRLSSIIDDLEALAETRPLSTQQIELKIQSNANRASLLREEEIKCTSTEQAIGSTAVLALLARNRHTTNFAPLIVS